MSLLLAFQAAQGPFQTGRAAVAVAGTGTEVHSAGATGYSAVGLAGRGVEIHGGSLQGASTVAFRAAGSAGKGVGNFGRGSVGFAGRGAEVAVQPVTILPFSIASMETWGQPVLGILAPPEGACCDGAQFLDVDEEAFGAMIP